MTCLSNVVERIRRMLLNYDLELARVEAEIALRQEKMDLLACVNGAKAQKEFLTAKVEKENYEVFRYRIIEQKKGLLRKVDLVASKYEGKYSKVFYMYFFEKASTEEICEKMKLKKIQVDCLIRRMEKDIYGNKQT